MGYTENQRLRLSVVLIDHIIFSKLFSRVDLNSCYSRIKDIQPDLKNLETLPQNTDLP